MLIVILAGHISNGHDIVIIVILEGHKSNGHGIFIRHSNHTSNSLSGKTFFLDISHDVDISLVGIISKELLQLTYSHRLIFSFDIATAAATLIVIFIAAVTIGNLFRTYNDLDFAITLFTKIGNRQNCQSSPRGRVVRQVLVNDIENGLILIAYYKCISKRIRSIFIILIDMDTLFF